MKIAVIGTGKIGSALATAWNGAGHRVVFGSRRGSGETDGITTASIADAVAASEIVVFAVPGGALSDVVHSLDLQDKTVIDCTNGGDSDSKTAAQMIAEYAPAAGVFKAFNTLGFENFRTPDFAGERPDHLYIGNDDNRRSIVEGLIDDVGLSPVYVGGLDAQAVLDAATRFWFALTRVYGRHVAYRLLRD